MDAGTSKQQSPNPAAWALRPLHKYATFSGRAPRAEFWWFYFAWFVIDRILIVIDSQLSPNLELLSLIFGLAVLVPWVAVTVRRLHDIDRSGWWLGAAAIVVAVVLGLYSAGLFQDSLTGPGSLLSVIALMVVAVTALVLLIFMVMPGTEGSNRFGPDPYAPDREGSVGNRGMAI